VGGTRRGDYNRKRQARASAHTQGAGVPFKLYLDRQAGAAALDTRQPRQILIQQDDLCSGLILENLALMTRSSLLELYLTRLREFCRQPARIFWVYGFPTILAVGLSLAFKSQPEVIQVDLVQSPASAPIEKVLRERDTGAQRQSGPRLLLRVAPADVALRRLNTGKTPLVVIADPSGPLTYRYDATRPEAVAAKAVVDDLIQTGFGRKDVVPTREITAQQPGSRYIDFLIPGLIGLNTMGGGLWGIGFLLVNFRIARLLKCLMATPMPRRNFLLALLGARLTFLFPDVGVMLLLGHLAFGMPIRGSLLLVFVIEVVAALAFAGIGLMVASRATTTETVSGLMNLVMLPMWVCSGVFFSAERFPSALQPIIQILPLTQLLNALRGVILEGMGWFDVAGALAILAAWAVLTFLVALRTFRWT
jgi:ABC-2 type transport system permease protein